MYIFYTLSFDQQRAEGASPAVEKVSKKKFWLNSASVWFATK
jgi:hypothetical protein